MLSLSYGELPDKETFIAHVLTQPDDNGDSPAWPKDGFTMELVDKGEIEAAASAYVEIKYSRDDFNGLLKFFTPSPHSWKTGIRVDTPEIMWDFLSQLLEDDYVDESSWNPATGVRAPGYELASSILYTLGIEWI